MPKPMQDAYTCRLVKNAASATGGYMGKCSRKRNYRGFYAEERIYVDAYNKEIRRGRSKKDARTK